MTEIMVLPLPRVLIGRSGTLTSWTAILESWPPQDEVIMSVGPRTDWPGNGLSQLYKTLFKIVLL